MGVGRHAPVDDAAMRRRVGDSVVERYACHSPPVDDLSRYVELGTTPEGVPVRVFRPVAEADVRLLIGSVLPHLQAGDGGAVLNISSAAGRIIQKNFVAYGTAKAALSFMTRQMAAELAPRVRVNALAVGAVETSALKPFLNDDLRSQMEALTPMGRIGTVEDIAVAALWLLSPAGGWVTGKVVEVDGGTEKTNWPFP